MSGSLARLFAPKSIAIVGASAARSKPGYAAMQALAGFHGPLYLINPRSNEINGRRAYPSLQAIGKPIDLAILAVPAEAVTMVLKDGAVAGLGAAVILAGGFAEVDDAGARLQAEVGAIARAAGIRLLGPNTSGFFNPAMGVYASFVPGVSDIRPGHLAVVAQSGGVNHALAFLAENDGLGLRLGVGLGNAIDVGFAAVLDYLADDPETHAIGLHVEGVADGRRLVGAVRRAASRKPIIALKVGKSDIGDFARSHTGNLMGNWALTRAALHQAGAVVVDDGQELVDCCAALAAGRLPPLSAAGVAVVTGQAGPGLLMADALRSAGVSVPRLSDTTVDTLGQLLPPLTYQRNPVDTGRPGPTFTQVLSAAAADASVDLLLVYALHEPGVLDAAAVLSDARDASGVPIIFATGGPRAALEQDAASIRAASIPVFTTPERAARAARALVADARARHRLGSYGKDISSRVPPTIGSRSTELLDEDQAKRVLELVGIRTPRRHACDSRDQAHKALAELGGSVVVKVLDRSIVHKSDVGGVVLGVESCSALEQALDRIDTLFDGRPSRYLIEEMVTGGAELIVGARTDPTFGPAVLVGLGGLAAEALGDIALRLAPVDPADVAEMLDSLSGRQLLDGYRGRPPVDRAALARVIIDLGDLLIAQPWIAAIDINPLVATDRGLIALDAVLLFDDVAAVGEGALANKD